MHNKIHALCNVIYEGELLLISSTRTILTATFLIGCTLGAGTASASPVVKTAGSTAASAYTRSADRLPAAAIKAEAAAAARTFHSQDTAQSKLARKIALISPFSPKGPQGTSAMPSNFPAMGNDSLAAAYAMREDFGKSNLHKWSSVHGMDTSWDDNEVTDTVHLQSSTIAFLDTLNADARAAGVSFVITGGAERGYHAHGTYSHENGYKVDISDDGVYAGTTSYRVLLEALAPYKHHLSHEWNNNHFDITIYPANYTGSYSGANHSTEDDDE